MAEMNVSGVEYREVVGIPGYRVGSDGSLWTCRQTSRGMTDSWKQLKCSIWSGGYVMATLRQDKRMIRKLLHHIVLEAFCGPCPQGMQGCHRNDNRLDNQLGNLRWDTPASNFRDRDRNGGTARGERSGKSKVCDEDVLQMRSLAATGVPLRAIAQQFPVNETTVGFIVSGQTWAHVGGPLTIPSGRKRPRTPAGTFAVEVVKCG